MLQRIIKSTAFVSAAMLVFSAALFSFSGKLGGDVFEVYINKKLAIQQYVHLKEPVKTLQLDQRNINDEIEVYYSHCGQTGTGRTISLRDAQNKILKEWHFQDTPGSKTSMTCNVKDITSVQKLNGGISVGLFYSSHELPAGKMLAAITTATGARSAR